MAAEDDFGDFNSAFPSSKASSASEIKLTSSNGGEFIGSFCENGARVESLSAPSVGPYSLPGGGDQLPGGFSFDAFAAVPEHDSRGGGTFADFGAFNVADVAIPPPLSVELGGFMFDIPPLPEELNDLTPVSSSAAAGTRGSDAASYDGTSAGSVAPDAYNFVPHMIPTLQLPAESDSTISAIHQPVNSINVDNPPTSSGNHIPSSLSDCRNSFLEQTVTGVAGKPLDALVPATTIESVMSDGESDFGDFESSIGPSMLSITQPSSESVGLDQEGIDMSLFSDILTSPGQPEPEAEAVAGQGVPGGFPGEAVAEFGDFSRVVADMVGVASFGSATTPQASVAHEQRGHVLAASAEEANPGSGRGLQEESALDFGAFQQPDTTGSGVLGGLGRPHNINAGGAPEPGFGEDGGKLDADEFGDFSVVAAVSSGGATGVIHSLGSFEPFASSNPGAGEGTGSFEAFGDFSNFQSSTEGAVGTTGSTGFGSFEAASSEVKSGADQLEGDSDFGAFEAFSVVPSSGGVTGNVFGEFSDSTGSSRPLNVSQFPSMPALPSSIQSTVAVKASTDALVLCFPLASHDPLVDSPDSTRLTTLAQLLRVSEGQRGPGVWQVLQRCVDFTVPLHKWDKSYVEDRYHGALSVDPELVSKPGVLPVLDTGLGAFGGLLSGQSTAEDLMESFGFESEPASAETSGRKTLAPPVRKTGGSGSRELSELPSKGEAAAPALLDLSLPASPPHDSEQDPLSSGLSSSDLLGLDLTVHSTSQLTSVQQLHLTEQLIVKPSTWKDSQLLELEKQESTSSDLQGRSDSPALSSARQNSSTPSTPRSSKRKGVNFEQQLLQLGLDASKTSVFSGASSKELSLPARTLLGRLPDLAFMTSETLVERSR